MRAILSVFDKTGLAVFARGLNELGFEAFSTGQTKRAIEDEGVPVRSIVEITGFPEILDGRVKTLHPLIYGGLLARRDKREHMNELAEHSITTIDLVAANLYPFVETISRDDTTLSEALESIDIGGPSMIRASAKNFPDVIVVVDPTDYGPVLEKLRAGGLDHAERKKLAQKAFQHVSTYDAAISQYLTQ